jgi:hypothetical protein
MGADEASDGSVAERARDGPAAERARDGPAAERARDGPGLGPIEGSSLFIIKIIVVTMIITSRTTPPIMGARDILLYLLHRN